MVETKSLGVAVPYRASCKIRWISFHFAETKPDGSDGPAEPGVRHLRLQEKGLDEKPFPIMRCFVRLTAHGGMGFTKARAFSELFSIEMPVLLPNLQTRVS